MSNETRLATTKARQTPIKHTNIATKKTQQRDDDEHQ